MSFALALEHGKAGFCNVCLSLSLRNIPPLCSRGARHAGGLSDTGRVQSFLMVKRSFFFWCFLPESIAKGSSGKSLEH